MRHDHSDIRSTEPGRAEHLDALEDAALGQALHRTTRNAEPPCGLGWSQ